MAGAGDRLARLAAALRDVPLPAAYVDLDAFDANAAALAARAAGRPIRLASKSIRCPDLMRRALGREGWRGILAYDAREAAALVADGFDDLVVAYPTADRAHLRALAPAWRAGASVALVVDDPAHVALAASVDAGVEVPLWIDVDVSLRAAGLHVGVRRSPIRTPADAVALAARIAATPGVRLQGVLAYEAQLAGVPDHSGNPAFDAVVRALKAQSRPDVRRRRAAVVDALRGAGHPVAHVNGGGTGSLGWSATDPSLTELTAGSGLLAPASFDGFDALALALHPAAGFALRITRVPAQGFATCAGGGYVASGAAGPSRLPRPIWPPGAALTPHEGAGEVQTPLRLAAGTSLAVGDVALFRHAKAGEPAERVERLILVRGGEIVGEAATYRGRGWAFS